MTVISELFENLKNLEKKADANRRKLIKTLKEYLAEVEQSHDQSSLKAAVERCDETLDRVVQEIPEKWQGAILLL